MEVAVVTGASRGIGRATAIKLGEKGLSVVINYVKNREEAEETKRLVEEAGGEGYTLRADVGVEEEVKGMFEEIKEVFGRVHYLVNNAGAIFHPPDLSASPEVVRRTVEVNMISVYRTTVHALPLMARGAIVNISSVFGPVLGGYIPAYMGAKAGVVGLTKALASVLAPDIRVNAVLPGNIWTDMTRGAPRDFLERMRAKTPLGRFGTPEEVAEAVVFLLFHPYITGQILIVDGGLSLGHL